MPLPFLSSIVEQFARHYPEKNDEKKSSHRSQAGDGLRNQIYRLDFF